MEHDVGKIVCRDVLQLAHVNDLFHTGKNVEGGHRA